MDSGFDMNVNSDELDYIKEKLITINNNLNETVEQMKKSIRLSGEYLSGRQFEKAQQIHSECFNETIKTCENIQRAIAFLTELQDVLEEYDKCRYDGG